jgi:hypothetical protein
MIDYKKETEVNFQSGKVLRVENWGLAFLEDQKTSQVHPFTFDLIQGYAGEPAAKIGLRVGGSVQFAMNKGIISAVRLAAAAANGTGKAAAHSRGA